MGHLLKSFNYPRNAFGASPAASAAKVEQVIDRARRQALTQAPDGKIKDEPFNDMRLFLAVVGGQPDAPVVTAVGETFTRLAEQSPVGAWRWVLTRAMWLYSVPNGSSTASSRAAKQLSVHFNFFDMVTRLSVHLSALPNPQNILFYDELLHVLKDDATWSLESKELLDLVLLARQTLGDRPANDHETLLDGLEPHHGLARDSMNSVFRKAFGQCGLFDIVMNGSHSDVGLRLDTGVYTNPVLGERLRFVLDHPRIYDEDPE